MILRPVVFTVGFAFGAIAQAAAQLSTPTPQPQLPPAPSTTVPAAAPSESATPTPAPTITPTETPTPTATPTLSPSPSASPLPTATPTASPTASAENPYKYVIVPPPDANAPPGSPQIMRVEINDRTVHVGGTFAVRITTTPNVSSVILSVEGHDIQIPKAQDGVFAGIQKIPGFIPPWFLKTYQVTFNAVTADGKKTSTTLPVTLAY